MTENSSHIAELYHSRNNLLDIMTERGFNVNEYTGFSVTEVHAMSQNEQLDLLLKKESDNTQIYIKYYLGKGLRPQMIDDMIEQLYDLEEILTKKDELLIITKMDANDTLLKHMVKVWKTQNIFVNIISLKRISFNILNHVLVPKHTIVPKEPICKRFNMENDSQIPELSRFDPVAMILGIRPGEMCKITRPSATAIECDYYRICI